MRRPNSLHQDQNGFGVATIVFLAIMGIMLAIGLVMWFRESHGYSADSGSNATTNPSQATPPSPDYAAPTPVPGVTDHDTRSYDIVDPSPPDDQPGP